MFRQIIKQLLQRHSAHPILWTLFVSCLLAPFNLALANHWQRLAPGIDYQDLNANPLTPWSHIHVFRIDLKTNHLDLATARESSKDYASVDDLAHQHHAQIAINGGFFDQAFRPLGLRIKNHLTYSPLKRISWWGIFYVQQETPHITSSWGFQADPAIDFAVQSGPRLIIDQHIPHLKPGTAERTALGITQRNKVIILVTDNTLLTTTELAHLMKNQPVNCVNAINLDGGSSTQLFAKIGKFHLNVHGFSNISDAILIKSQ